jgi:hypothetical protein
MKKKKIQQPPALIETDYDCEIDTGEIYSRELRYANNPESFKRKKCPDELAEQLLLIIQRLLVNHHEPTVNDSYSAKEYLKERFKTFDQKRWHDHSFSSDYFVLSMDSPQNETGPKRIDFAGSKHFYLYSYDIPLLVKKNMADSEQFEHLFAFALRQCNLMKVDALLSYQFETNFGGDDLKSYLKYVTQLTRKFGNDLFNQELIDSIYDWIKEQEKNPTGPQYKITTVLTVDQLACLFRLLVETKLVTTENKSLLARLICRSFESKGTADISAGSLSKHLFAPTDGAIEFWEGQFTKLIAKRKELQEEN